MASDFQRYLDEALPKCVLAPEEEDCVKQEPARPQRLIDANTLPVTTLTDGGYWTKDVVYKRDIDAAPTVDAVEVVHGRWEDVREIALYVPDMKYTVTRTDETCSVCKVRIGFIGSKLYLYDHICPNCGAKMDGGKDNG